MRTIFHLLITGSLMILSASAYGQSQADQDAIKSLLVAHTEKWNVHDMDAWSEILHDDADWVPTVALAHVRSEMTGDERSPGETFQYRKTIVFTKKGEVWRIRALHNTRIRPDAIAASGPGVTRQ